MGDVLMGPLEVQARRFRKHVRRLVWNRVLSRRPEVAVTFDDGLRLHSPTNNVSARSTYVLGAKDPLPFLWMDRFLRPGMSVLDVGANVGSYALYMAKRVGPEGRLVAVEPNAANLAYLRRNVEANRLAQIAVEPVAVGDQTAQARMLVSETNRGAHCVALDGEEHSTEAVAMVRLDDLVAKHGLARVDFVKMDIEGFEHRALLGFERTLRAGDPVLLIEHSHGATERYGDSLDALRAFLEDLGYAAHELRNDGFVPYDWSRRHGDAFWSRRPLGLGRATER